MRHNRLSLLVGILVLLFIPSVGFAIWHCGDIELPAEPRITLIDPVTGDFFVGAATAHLMRVDEATYDVTLVDLVDTPAAMGLDPARRLLYATHAGTGMVIRAFAVHPRYRRTKEAKTAALLLTSQFFKKDNSASYQAVDNWVNFKYPFFWTDLISALDSVSLIGIRKDDKNVQTALDWLRDHQLKSGLWKNTYSRIHKTTVNKKALEARLWISLAICRIFKRYYEE